MITKKLELNFIVKISKFNFEKNHAEEITDDTYFFLNGLVSSGVFGG
jgi:hypothetical protein